MRAEARFPADVLGDSDQMRRGGCNRSLVIYYFSTGEEVPSGVYRCTFCGGEIQLMKDSVLPLCPACDSAEFTRVEADEATPELDSLPSSGV